MYGPAHLHEYVNLHMTYQSLTTVIPSLSLYHTKPVGQSMNPAQMLQHTSLTFTTLPFFIVGLIIYGLVQESFLTEPAGGHLMAPKHIPS